MPLNKFGQGNGYIYSQYGYDYGIERKQLNSAIENNYPHFVICNDVETIKKLKQDYKNHICVVYLRFDAPEETILAIQKTRGITDDEIAARMSKIEYLKRLFLQNSSFFDQILSNKYGENPEVSLWQQMKNIMFSYENVRPLPSKEIVFEMIDYLQRAIRDSEKNEAQNSKIVEKDFVFIIMPMVQSDRTIAKNNWNVYTTIKAAAQAAGYRAERVDKIQQSSTIDEKTFEHIKKAEIIIADLSYERPNCYFELGYAKALGKDVIIIARKGTKVHFDVDHYDYISFEEEEQLASELETRLFKFRNYH